MRNLIPILAVLVLASSAQASWDLSKHSIPVDEILAGGPPKDGIPALLDPRFLSGEEAANLLEPGDRVIGYSSAGVAKAYPVRILNYHELVNDEVGGSPILVSW
ncbi:MAG: DUF3179 domain-containing protein [bacterium]|nr:MAG: DUF3179 domain-containing protein [bacterium]